jgi:hypothetical protein
MTRQFGGFTLALSSQETTTMTHDPIPDAPPPPDATQLFDWTTDEGGLFREFSGATREVSGARICISGYQNGDGTCHRWLSLQATEVTALTPGEARELGAALQSAAEEVERLE